MNKDEIEFYKDRAMKTNVKGCARCGKDHDGVTFFPISTTWEVIAPSRATHRGRCPNTDRVIWLYMREKDDED